MIEFEALWVWLLLPLPLVAYWFLPQASVQASGLKMPLPPGLESSHKKPTFSWRLFLLLAAWGLLLLALSKPVHYGAAIQLPSSGRDLMLAVDLSGSMREKDFIANGRRSSRLNVTKAVAAEFIQRRQGDRMGLILFADNAYLQVPLTYDRNTVSEYLMDSVIGLAGERTAIGDAIGIAIKKLSESGDSVNQQSAQFDLSNKVLILMTDGQNSAGTVSPKDAVNMAKKNKLKIYTIGIGYRSGDFDERTLKAIAIETGGRYFHAYDTNSFKAIYETLDKLEPISHEGQKWQPKTDLFYWPLLLMLACVSLASYHWPSFPWSTLSWSTLSRSRMSWPTLSSAKHLRPSAIVKKVGKQ